uniref:Immunoglobulin heavy variable 6-1 n=1 Tax=Sander lucioperca TaxID=283035 RepID=A0A8D0DA05_SANLU
MENTWSLLFVVTIHFWSEIKLDQSPFEVKRPGETVKMSCIISGYNMTSNFIYWIQQRPGEALDLYSGVPNRFTVSRDINRKQVYLQINGVQTEDSAVYYCADGEYRRYWIFGSGTKLIVSDEPVVKPVVSVYPAASRAHLEGKSSLLCLASAMFPPLVQLSWKRQKENGPLEDLLPAEGEQLVIRKSACTAAILLIHQQEKRKYKYRCYVRHEGGPVEAETQQGNEGLVTVDRPPTEHMLTDCFLLTFSHHQIS